MFAFRNWRITSLIGSKEVIRALRIIATFTAGSSTRSIQMERDLSQDLRLFVYGNAA
jgi:hypothetical protein